MMSVQPRQTDDLLMNPGTGWQLLVAGPPADEMEQFPLVSTFYYRIGWTAFEPERGQYENSQAIRAIDAWLAEAARHGRYVGIRVVPYNSRNPRYQRRHSQKVQGCDSIIPPYIFEEGAKGFPEPGGSGGWVPVFWDPIYLKYHRKLAAFLGQRYGGHPNLAYVDVPAGNYGEMNLTNTEVPQLDDLSTWREYGLTADSWRDMLRDLCDMYREAFPNDLLVAARDYDAYEGGPDALTYAVGKGVGFRDDGLGMPYCGPGKTNPQYEENWDQVLCLYENGYRDWRDWGGEQNVRAVLDWAIERTHASIVMAGKGESSLRSYRPFLPLIEEYGPRLGYRLVVQEAQWPRTVSAGADIPLTLVWRNLGNAPPYQPFGLETSLLDHSGNAVWSTLTDPEALATTTWMPDCDRRLELSIDLPSELAPGRYTLAISLVDLLPDPDGGEPRIRRRIALALSETAGDRRYPLGELAVE